LRSLFSKKGLTYFFLFSLCAFIFFGIGISYWFQHPHHNKSTVVLIPKGASLTQIASHLNTQGVLDLPLLFKAFLYGTRSWKDLKAGEYFIPEAISPAQLIYILKKGDVILHPVSLIEGETSHSLVQKLLADTRFEGACDIPHEGTILPETYHFPRGTIRSHIIAHMQKTMKEKLAEVWAQRPSTHPLHSPEELVVLASIIEKETALSSEKPFVAAVFLNRLKQGMPLQADPTVLYALTEGKGGLGRDLTRHDLQVESPYNTYLKPGLPPLPIANPSLSSLKAIVSPAAVPYLYFVADGSGGHVFATTLEEHQQNHAAWRKVQKKVSRNNQKKTL
jgi:UPF0755 protein